MGRGDLNASQLGKGPQRGASTSDRDIELAVMKVLTDKLGLNERMVQDLQALAGLRSEATGAKPMAAVRRGELGVINKIPPLQSKDALGTVTVQDFNALRKDVRGIFEALATIARAVK